MNATAKHTPGRWTYTSACPVFENDTDKVRAYSGSIHAGWEDSPEFASAEEFYAWAKAECERRNVLEAAAPDLLAALKAQLAYEAAPSGPGRLSWLDLVKVRDAALAKAEGR